MLHIYLRVTKSRSGAQMVCGDLLIRRLSKGLKSPQKGFPTAHNIKTKRKMVEVIQAIPRWVALHPAGFCQSQASFFDTFQRVSL